MTVTAYCERLPPLLVFKGTPGVRIEQREFSLPNHGLYVCMENAWMDDQMMLS